MFANIFVNYSRPSSGVAFSNALVGARARGRVRRRVRNGSGRPTTRRVSPSSLHRPPHRGSNTAKTESFGTPSSVKRCEKLTSRRQSLSASRSAPLHRTARRPRALYTRTARYYAHRSSATVAELRWA